jgi:endonuclease III
MNNLVASIPTTCNTSTCVSDVIRLFNFQHLVQVICSNNCTIQKVYNNFISIILHSVANSKLSTLNLFSSLTVYALWHVLFTVTFTSRNARNLIHLGRHMALRRGELSLRAHSKVWRAPKTVRRIMDKQWTIFLNRTWIPYFYSWQLNMPIPVAARSKA